MKQTEVQNTNWYSKLYAVTGSFAKGGTLSGDKEKV